MSELGLPVVCAVLVWWFSTGVVLYLDGLPQRTYRHTFTVASVLAVLALYGLGVSAEATSVGGAYTAFGCALMVWAWVELSFLLGFVTGPRKVRCAAGCGGLGHFWHGVMAVLWHELALVCAGVLVYATTHEGPNLVGLWTFAVLWGMRESAKLNVFFGVRNLSEEFLPDHLRYLESYFRRRPMNAFFPVSITVSTAIAAVLLARATDAAATPHETAGYALVLSLLGLAILEHWFLVLPLSLSRLWQWAAQRRDRQVRAEEGGEPPLDRRVQARLRPLRAAVLPED